MIPPWIPAIFAAAIGALPAPGEIVPAAPGYARARYVVSRQDRPGLALPDHRAAGWEQRVRLMPDGRTDVTVVSSTTLPPRTDVARPPDLERWTDATSIDPEIVALAQELAHGTEDPRELSERIITWVSANVSHVDVPAHGDAPVAVLTTRIGSCVGRSRLAVQLMRSAGLPARTIHGILVQEDARGEASGFLPHRFVESWIDGIGWVPSDPGVSIHLVDARHLVVALDDAPYDADSLRDLVLREAEAPQPLTLLRAPLTVGARPIVGAAAATRDEGQGGAVR